MKRVRIQVSDMVTSGFKDGQESKREDADRAVPTPWFVLSVNSPKLAFATATLPQRQPARHLEMSIVVKDFESPNVVPLIPTPTKPIKMTGRRPIRL